MTINVHAAPTINSFTATPSTIYTGQGSSLTWSVNSTGTTTLSINQGVGTVSTTSPLVKPTTTTTYTLTATNPGGTRTATCTVTVAPPPVITSFTATPTTINRGQSTTLNWAINSQGQPTYFQPPQRWASKMGGYSDAQKWLSGDFNGDGWSDLARVFNDNGLASADVFLSDRGRFFTYTRWVTQCGGFWDTQQWMAGDFNGDGRCDIARAFTEAGLASVDVFPSMPNNTFSAARWQTKAGGFWDTQQWVAGDFNGDGKCDLAKAFTHTGNGLACVDVHLSTGSSFGIARWATDQGGFWPTQKWIAGDFNGDGKWDLAKAFTTAGSGLANIDVHLSNGSSFGIARWASNQGGFWDTQKWLAGDFNGDGKWDLAKAFNYGSTAACIDVHPSTGSGFGIERWSTDRGVNSDPQKWVVGDFDGDGRRDLATILNDAGLATVDVYRADGSVNAASSVSLSLDNGIGTVTGTSHSVQPQTTTTYTLTATNPSGSVSSTSTTIVVNQPPTHGAFTIPSVNQGQAVNCVLPTATDPESDAIDTYAVAGLPSGLSFDPATRTLTGTLTTPGAYRFLYCAIDAKGAMGSRMLDLDVLAAGVAPTTGTTLGVDYTYDSEGRLATMTYPSGRVVAYAYDALDRVTKVTQNGQDVVRQIDYDAWGNRTQQLNASGAIDQWTYDTPGLRVTQWTIGTVGGTPEARTYAYDTADRLTKAGEWGTLTYDANSRLTQAVGFGLTNTLAHDAYNNNTGSVTTSANPVPGTLNNFTFNPMVDNHLPGQAANGGLTQVSETNFGEITNLGTGMSSASALSMTWDDLGRMTSTRTGATGAVAAYRYAPSGMRVTRTDSQNPALNRVYAYTGSGQLLGEYTLNADGAPVWARDVIYLGSQAVAEINANGTHELHSDHLGSPRVTTAAAGTVEGTQAYGPYGELLQQSGYVPLTGYTGHIQTEPTGLIYMRGRFYSPAWHRFMNSDGGVDPDDLNQFAYLGGDPLSDTDSSGMAPDKDGPWNSRGWSASEERKSDNKNLDNINKLRDWHQQASKSNWFNKKKLNDLVKSHGFETIAVDVTEMSNAQIGKLYAGWHKEVEKIHSDYGGMLVMGMAGANIQKTSNLTVTTSNGIEITGIKQHAIVRCFRSLKNIIGPKGILDALTNALKKTKVVEDQFGRPSQRFIGRHAEVVVNPETGEIVSINPTSTKKAEKLLRALMGE